MFKSALRASFIEIILFTKNSQIFFLLLQLEQFLIESRNDSLLVNDLHQDQVVFFVHLLGIDTNGHRHNPHSQETRDNLKFVDEGRKSISKSLPFDQYN